MTDFTRYRKLSEVAHVLLRPQRYLGATAPQTQNTYVFVDGKVTWRDVTWSPAFVKLFDEIISNSVDFSKKPEGKHLNRIEITASKITGQISINDNGGIPVVIHPDENQWLPDMLLGELRSGSNFNDDEASETTGQNGEGASLAGIFSTLFHVQTADRKNLFDRQYLNNFKDRTDIIVKPSKEGFTKITYEPDYARLGMSLDDDHYAMIERRAYEVAACNPHLKVFFNSKLLSIGGFKDFATMFDPEVIYTETDKWQIAIGHSPEGFKQVSFVNSTLTSVGGLHIDYITERVVAGIREKIEKKTKQKIKPHDIKSHFFLFVNARIDKPRYDSQTKENLKSPWTSWGSVPDIDEKFIKKIAASKIVAEVIEWAMRKQAIEDAAALREKLKDGKKQRFNDILKYEPAVAKDDRSKCILIVCEGDSAKAPILEARNAEIHGLLPLRGKSMNVRDAKISDVKKNEELINLMRIIGLEIGVVPVRSELRYQYLLIASDQDWDGHHIKGLVINLFQTFWPSLLKEGFVLGLNTPIVRVVQGKQEHEFFSEADYEAWSAKQTKPFSSTYLKGLGGNTAAHFQKYLADDSFMVQFVFEDEEDFKAIDIAFQHGDGASDLRKKWLYSDKV